MISANPLITRDGVVDCGETMELKTLAERWKTMTPEQKQHLIQMMERWAYR